MSDIEAVISRVKSRSAGRTRYEGQEPFDDELLLEEITRLRSERAAVPEGWVMVPVEPTAEMLDVAILRDRQWSINSIPRIKNAYKAMLAARPTPPAQNDQEGRP